MDRKDGIIWALTVTIFAILFVGAILYYNNQLDELKAHVGILNSQTVNLQKPDLVTSLGIYEKLNATNSTYIENDPSTYNHLLIEGTVTNMGLGTAYHAGLHVIARTITGEVVIDMTVPLAAGSYGLEGNKGPSELGDLPSKGIGEAQIAIYHQGIAATWSVTPVCDS
jgi:hypothetical protein